MCKFGDKISHFVYNYIYICACVLRNACFKDFQLHKLLIIRPRINIYPERKPYAVSWVNFRKVRAYYLVELTWIYLKLKGSKYAGQKCQMIQVSWNCSRRQIGWMYWGIYMKFSPAHYLQSKALTPFVALNFELGLLDSHRNESFYST